MLRRVSDMKSMKGKLNGSVAMCKKAIAEIRKDYEGLVKKPIEVKLNAMQGYVDRLFQDGDIGVNPPIPIVKIAEKMGFSVFEKRFDRRELSGIIAIDSDLKDHKIYQTDRVVCVNSEDSSSHRRFTIAHELAHYIFDFDEQNKITYYDAYITDEADSDKERVANRFAAELLMPKANFEKDFEKLFKNKIQPRSMNEVIAELMEKYAAPSTAVQRRILELDLLQEWPELVAELEKTAASKMQ